MVSDRIVIRKGSHQYNWDFRADALRIQAHRETYRQFGLLILAVLFHEQPAHVQLDLTHPASDIRHLVVEYVYSDEYDSWYTSRPYFFRYYPDETDKHPWLHEDVAVADLPRFVLTTLEEEQYREDGWARRDTVRGFGSDRATVRLAELLLDAGRPDNPVQEYELEGEGGFRGVGVHSAEVSLYLPGSMGWDGIL
jgi:hypothetical protein